MLWGSAADLISAFAALAVAVIGWWQLGSIRDQVKAAREEARIERTLTACSRYESDVVVERCVRRLRLAFENKTPIAEPAEHKHDVIIVLNYLDGLAIGFEQKLYDENLAKDHMASIVRMYRQRYLSPEYLDRLKIDSGDYHCLIKLADKWDSKAIGFRVEEPSRPVPTANALRHFGVRADR
jgi:hypothetical protein